MLKIPPLYSLTSTCLCVFNITSPISKELYEIFNMQTINALTSKALVEHLQLVISTNIHKWVGWALFFMHEEQQLVFLYSFYRPTALVVIWYASERWSVLSVLIRLHLVIAGKSPFSLKLIFLSQIKYKLRLWYISSEIRKSVLSIQPTWWPAACLGHFEWKSERWAQTQIRLYYI